MKYSFMWKRDTETRRKEGCGWFSKTVTASSDAEAIEKMEAHLKGRGPVEIDYEMCREDVPYDAKQHAARFLDLRKAGIELLMG